MEDSGGYIAILTGKISNIFGQNLNWMSLLEACNRHSHCVLLLYWSERAVYRVYCGRGVYKRDVVQITKRASRTAYQTLLWVKDLNATGIHLWKLNDTQVMLNPPCWEEQHRPHIRNIYFSTHFGPCSVPAVTYTAMPEMPGPPQRIDGGKWHSLSTL